MSLSIYLLGQFKILANDNPVELPSRPAQSLLAFLALSAGNIHRREKLASMLWPETTDSNARGYLRQALWRIRKTFEKSSIPCDDYLKITDIHITFNHQSDYWLDTDQILTSSKGQSIEQIITNIQHYGGELLPGFYDDWIPVERDRFQAAFNQKMNILTDKLILAEEWDETVKWSEHQIRHGFAPEPAYRALMNAYAHLGDRGMVKATYQRCEKALEQDLGVEPSMETQQLFEQLCRESPAIPSKIFEQNTSTFAPPDFFTGEAPIPFEEPLFVARANELSTLDRFLNKVLDGEGSNVFITGEAGSGKTALISEFIHLAQAEHPELLVASGNCNAQTGIGDPYLPFREILELLTGDVKAQWDAGAISKSHAQCLWNNLPIAVKALVESGPDLIDTFIPGVALLERSQTCMPEGAGWYSRLNDLVKDRKTNPYFPHSHQSTLFEQYTKVLLETSSSVPLVLILDDLQWADLGSISLLFHLGRHLPGNRIMVIGAYRPEEVSIGREGKRHPLAPVIRELQRIYGDILINMDQAENWEFMEAYIDSEPNHLGKEFRQMLYRQTHGNPLFMIEFLRGLQERGDLVQDSNGCWNEGLELDWETLPARVEAVITERIDRLPSHLQRALHVASVEGDLFTAEVVAQVQNISQHELLNQLGNDLDRKHRLVRAQSIQRVDGQLLSNYRFRHIQIQKFLYSSLDQVERVHLHEQIGLILENLYEAKEAHKNLAKLSTSVTPIVQLAHHFQEARIIPKAVSYLHLSGERAVQLSSYQDAITHLSKGLELLEKLPDTPERNSLELTLLLALGKAFRGVEGMAPLDVEKVFTRAYYLGQQFGEPAQICLIMGELAIIYYVRADYQRARELSEETLNLAKAAKDPVLIALSHWQMGFVLFARGEFITAREHLQEIISSFDPNEYHHQFVYLKGANSALSALAYDAACLWCLGYPEQAFHQGEKAFRLAKQIGHPFTMADVITFAGCILNGLCEDPKALLFHADTLIQLSDKIGLGWRGAGWRHRGEALVMAGQVKEGIADAKKGMEDDYSRAAHCFETSVLGKIAYAQAKEGQIDSGLKLIDDALAQVVVRNEFFSQAELFRLKAEILLLNGDPGEAEVNYQKAIEVSKQQLAKSWELRASIGLANLWISLGKSEKAGQLLAPIYDWFTEGFDTPDLIQAKELLDQIEISGDIVDKRVV